MNEMLNKMKEDLAIQKKSDREREETILKLGAHLKKVEQQAQQDRAETKRVVDTVANQSNHSVAASEMEIELKDRELVQLKAELEEWKEKAKSLESRASLETLQMEIANLKDTLDDKQKELDMAQVELTFLKMNSGDVKPDNNALELERITNDQKRLQQELQSAEELRINLQKEKEKEHQMLLEQKEAHQSLLVKSEQLREKLKDAEKVMQESSDAKTSLDEAKMEAGKVRERDVIWSDVT